MLLAFLALLFSLYDLPPAEHRVERYADVIWAPVSESPVYEVQRSSEWARVRKAFLEVYPVCEACGGTEHLEVHHVKPYHLFPSLELNPMNLMTLCDSPSRKCHFVIGHLTDWRSYNVDARADAAALRSKIENRPRPD